MGTITQNLEKLVAAKNAIAAAIVAKGGTVGANDGFEEFAADIATIPYDPPMPEPSLVQFTEWDDSWTLENFQSITGAIYYTTSELPATIDRQASESAWIIYGVNMSTSKFLIVNYTKTGEFYSTTTSNIDDIKSLLTKNKKFFYFAYVS